MKPKTMTPGLGYDGKPGHRQCVQIKKDELLIDGD